MTGPLSTAQVPGYIAARPALADLVDTTSLDVKEVGDGNLNQVFICRDANGASLVLKQSLPYVRLVGPSWPMTEERAAREARAISEHSAVSPYVCSLIDYDTDRYVLALEDLSDHQVFRTRLNEGGSFAGVAEKLGIYVADIAFGTSFLAIGEEQFRAKAAAAINTELCALTEDLIFTEPYLGAKRNCVQPAVQGLLDELQADHEWIAAAMAMKRRFITVAECLVHGDLHSGSVFVRGDGNDLSVKAFDPEFAFYGPVGFDLGLMWSNMLAAGARAYVLGETDRASALAMTVASSWDAFDERMRQLWANRLMPTKYPDSFLTGYLESIRVDSFGFAGCEAARRTVGLAKVSDIESLTGHAHVQAASAMLRLSRLLLCMRDTLTFDQLQHQALDYFGGGI